MEFVSDTLSKSLLHGLDVSPYNKQTLKKSGIWKIQKN